jgi:hypothetical protein
MRRIFDERLPAPSLLPSRRGQHTGQDVNFGYWAINQRLLRNPAYWLRGLTSAHKLKEPRLQGRDERRSARAKVLLSAVIECDGLRIPVKVVNLSANGVLVASNTFPPEGKRLIFRCGGRTAEGWSAWVHPPHAGINFDTRIDPKAFLPKTLVTTSMITRDARRKDFRRPGFRGNQMSDEEKQIVDEWTRSQLRDSAGEATAGEPGSDIPRDTKPGV